MLRSIKNLPSRQPINHVVSELKDQGQENGPTESKSTPLDENSQTDREAGRDATLSKLSGKNCVHHRPSVIISPKKSRFNNRNFAVHRPARLIEDMPESPCSSSSHPIPQDYSNYPSRPSLLLQPPNTSPVRTSIRSTLSNSTNSPANESVRSSRSSILKAKNQSLTPSPPRKSHNESPLRSPIVSKSISPIKSPDESKTVARSSPKSTTSNSSPRRSLTILNLNWKKSKYSDQIEHAIIMKDEKKGFVLGMFRFFGKCEKPNQKTADYRTNFTLMKGRVSIKIGDEPYMTINELESVSIPELTNYQIKNLIDGESVLQFHIC